jgi:hypothetical protein
MAAYSGDTLWRYVNQSDYSENNAIPIRQPAYAQLLVDSEDRQAGQPVNNFTIYRNQALLYGYFFRLAITQIQFHWDFPTIVGRVNDTFSITDTTLGITYAATITPGYYNPTTLAAAVQEAILGSADFATYTCVYYPLTNSLRIDSNNTNTFTFVSYTTFPAESPNYTLYRNTARTIGIPLQGNFPAPSQFLAVPQLIYTQYVDIISRTLTKFQRVKDTDTSNQNPKSFIVARLYLCPPNTLIETTATTGLGSHPFFICTDYNSPKYIKWSPDEALSEIDLQVVDENGNELYWDPDNANWSYEFTLLASET